MGFLKSVLYAVLVLSIAALFAVVINKTFPLPPECADSWCRFTRAHPRMAACFEYSGRAMFHELKFSHGLKPEYCDRMEQNQ